MDYKRNKLQQSIVGKYPFVYYISSKGYKYIGYQVFRDCSSVEINLYKEYIKLMEKIDEAVLVDKICPDRENPIFDTKKLKISRNPL